MFDFSALSWLPILVVTVAAFMLGGVYYGPLFGKAWVDALGKKMEDIEPSPLPFVVSFVTSFVASVTMALLVEALRLDSVLDGALLGGMIGLGIIAASMASDYAFCGFRLKLWLIQSGYRIAYTILMGAVFAVWR